MKLKYDIVLPALSFLFICISIISGIIMIITENLDLMSVIILGVGATYITLGVFYYKSSKHYSNYLEIIALTGRKG